MVLGCKTGLPSRHGDTQVTPNLVGPGDKPRISRAAAESLIRHEKRTTSTFPRRQLTETSAHRCRWCVAARHLAFSDTKVTATS